MVKGAGMTTADTNAKDEAAPAFMVPPQELVTSIISGDSIQKIARVVDEAKTYLEAISTSINARRARDFFSWAKEVESLIVGYGYPPESQLDAKELLRRGERALGRTVRNGQRAGIITDSRNNRGKTGRFLTGSVSPKIYFPAGGQNQTFAYRFTDGVSDALFEEAIKACREEGSLSRRSVAEYIANDVGRRTTRDRTLARIQQLADKNFTSHQIMQELGYSRVSHIREMAALAGISIPADEVVGDRPRSIDPGRLIGQTAYALTGLSQGIRLIDKGDIAELDPVEIREWYESLCKSLPELTRLRRELSRYV
jgi:hypothetical protein